MQLQEKECFKINISRGKVVGIQILSYNEMVFSKGKKKPKRSDLQWSSIQCMDEVCVPSQKVNLLWKSMEACKNFNIDQVQQLVCNRLNYTFLLSLSSWSHFG